VQYSIRNVPPELDAALRERAKRLGKSLNTIALEALASAVAQPARQIGLSEMPHGFMSKREHEELEGFLDEQRGIDDELWK
jgi:hypothetical protein